MIENSWKWAASRNLLRKNGVHGEEEAKLIISETFDSKNETGELMEWSGEAECEDRGSVRVQHGSAKTNKKFNFEICSVQWVVMWHCCSLEDPDGSLMDSHLVPDDDFPLAGPASGESEQAVKEAAAVAASAGSSKGSLELTIT